MQDTEIGQHQTAEHRSRPLAVRGRTIRYIGTPDIPADMRISQYRRSRNAGRSRRRWRRFF
ncbi:MAG TPA: hypothetical protein VE570_11260 [Thermoleophilaceae bacterium]|jgi:hypothetical protein|nr:hypothetical protein [Thermoleophilaceae bacterium]